MSKFVSTTTGVGSVANGTDKREGSELLHGNSFNYPDWTIKVLPRDQHFTVVTHACVNRET